MYKTMKLFIAALLVVAIFPRESHATATDSGEKSRMIVTFLNNHNAQQEEAEFLKNDKKLILESYKNVHAYVADLTPSMSAQLDQSSNIIVEQDFKVKMQSTYTNNKNWGAIRVGAGLANFGGLTGKGVKIGIIDTGIQTNNPQLKVVGGYNFVSNNTNYQDTNGHGTHVAGIIAAKPLNGLSGIAPDAQLYSLKVLNNYGEGYLSDIIAAIDWAVQNKLDIINMSLGESEPSAALEQAVNRAYDSGLLVVAAAGNDGNTSGDDVEYPARYSSVIAVGATTSSNKLASFSSTGKEVEVTAPGDNIYSTYIGSTFADLSGTSMATPHVTGVLALYKQEYPKDSNVQLRSLLDKNAIDLGPPGRDSYYGYGLVKAPVSITITPNPNIHLQAMRVSSTEIRLLWKGAGTQNYIIKRNGSTIYTGNAKYFFDKNAPSGKSYQYTIFYNTNGLSVAAGKVTAS